LYCASESYRPHRISTTTTSPTPTQSPTHPKGLEIFLPSACILACIGVFCACVRSFIVSKTHRQTSHTHTHSHALLRRNKIAKRTKTTAAERAGKRRKTSMTAKSNQARQYCFMCVCVCLLFCLKKTQALPRTASFSHTHPRWSCNRFISLSVGQEPHLTTIPPQTAPKSETFVINSSLHALHFSKFFAGFRCHLAKEKPCLRSPASLCANAGGLRKNRIATNSGKQVNFAMPVVGCRLLGIRYFECFSPWNKSFFFLACALRF
jgi:hypothetical protein